MFFLYVIYIYFCNGIVYYFITLYGDIMTKNSKNSKTTVKQVVETNSINHQTGEVLNSVETITKRIPNEPDYIKLYLADILYLNDMPKGMNSLLLALLKKMNYGNEIVLNSYIKKQIAEELGIKPNTINQNLSMFVKKNIFHIVGTGTYLANPFLFGRGKWEEINQLRVKMEIRYSFEGRKITSEVEGTTQQSIFAGFSGYSGYSEIDKKDATELKGFESNKSKKTKKAV